MGKLTLEIDRGNRSTEANQTDQSGNDRDGGDLRIPSNDQPHRTARQRTDHQGCGRSVKRFDKIILHLSA